MSEVRKLNTILFADITGYTSLMQKDEKHALVILNHFKEILEETVPTYGGVIVQYFGDGCLLTFDSSTKGVEGAIALQRAFQEGKIPIRVGLHLGEVLFKNNNAFGDGVNIASRIESLGIPGSILISKSVRDQVKNKSEFQLVRKGSFEFKNVDEAIEVFAIANEGIVVPKKSEMNGKTRQNTRSKKLVFGGIILALILVYLTLNHGPSPTKEVDKSIAVLPFVDMSPTQDQAYLGDGVAEEILNIISKIKELKVIARTSSFQFRGTQVDVRDLSAKLGVNYVLEGSIRKIDNQVRITAQLINSRDGSHIWSENYNRQFDDIFLLQDDIAAAISKQLKTTMGIEEESIQLTKNIKAYESYLKGVHIHHNIDFFSSHINDNFEAAKNFFLEAINLDSNFAEAHAALSDLYDSGIALLPDDTSFIIIAEKESEIAIKLKPKSSYALLSQALVHYRKTEFDRSINLYLQALNSDANNHYAYAQLALLFDDMGLHHQTLEALNKAITLDPLNPNYLNSRGSLLRHLGLLTAAIKDFEQATLLGSQYSKLELFMTHCLTKDFDKVENLYAEISEDTNFDLLPEQTEFLRAILLASQGDHKALDLVDEGTIFIIQLVLGNLGKESDQWFSNFENNIDLEAGLCCPQPKTITLDQSFEADSIYSELLRPLMGDSRFKSLYKKYEECVEKNKKKYSL